MAKKYYAVKVGQTTGIFDNWAECERSVKGYPGALYKGFENKYDAYVYMGWEGKQLSFFNETDLNLGDEDNYSPSPLSNEEAPQEVPFSNSVKAIAYVDGSYNVETKEYGYGAVIFYNGEQLNLSGKGNTESLANMRNVAGEIWGSITAMKYALDNKIPHLTIVYDYLGIEKWCTGDWKTNKEATIMYKKYYDDIKKHVDIKFEKVKGHSGDKYNDLADRLAKDAVGVR